MLTSRPCAARGNGNTPVTRTAGLPPAPSSTRLPYLDNLRVTLTASVVFLLSTLPQL
ncbi:hypothetical protein GCM10010156_78240 [Planobispora rosea]|nr:hypothetical protein GCM10010156_78240 [Planobispora rosea]